MSPRVLRGRRPSAALVISSAALFMSMGGVGAAATGLIGTNQIRNDAVTYKKIAPDSVGRVRLANNGVVNSKLAHGSVSYQDIQPNAVGAVRANLNQLQARVKGSCAAGSAVGTVSDKGALTCNATTPARLGVASTTPTNLSGSTATAASLNLTTGATWMAFGNTELHATSGNASQLVTVKCTLTVGTATSTNSVTMRTDGTAGDVTSVVLPDDLAGPGGASSITCTASVPTGETLPATTATSSLNAIQVAS